MSRVHAPRTRPATLVLTSLLLTVPSLAACASTEATEAPAAESNLGPSFDARDGKRAEKNGKKDARADAKKSERAKKRRKSGAQQSPTEKATDRPESGGTSSGDDAAAPETSAGTTTQTAAPAPAGPLRASAGDPRGDVRGGLTGAPDHVDLVGATVRRTAGGFEVRVDVAGTLPTRMEGSRTQNIALFYDLDRDGQVDYETWGALSDSGWSGSYRTPGSARYGADSGISVRAEGATLVLTFPLSHLEGARRFDWQFGSEWGTYEQVASGTTAVDRAAEGGVAFPG